MVDKGILQNLQHTRSLEHFKKLPNPPYFLSYEAIEIESAGASGSFGALVGSSPLNRRRSLGIDLRVGSYALDNTHPIRGALFKVPDSTGHFGFESCKNRGGLLGLRLEDRWK